MADLLPEKWMKGIAITTTVLAVVASIASSRSSFFTAKAQLLTALEGSQWDYYQAKSIKQNLYETQQKAFQVDLLGATSPEQREFSVKICRIMPRSLLIMIRIRRILKSRPKPQARIMPLLSGEGHCFPWQSYFHK